MALRLNLTVGIERTWIDHSVLLFFKRKNVLSPRLERRNVHLDLILDEILRRDFRLQKKTAQFHYN